LKKPMVKEPTPEQWEDLANAIIIRAAFDYRTARKRLKEAPDNMYLKRVLKEIECFLLSDWYRCLTRVDGRYLLRRLKNEPVGWSPTKHRVASKRGAKE